MEPAHLGAPPLAGLKLDSGIECSPTSPGPANIFPDESQPGAFTSLSLPNITITAGLLGMGHS